LFCGDRVHTMFEGCSNVIDGGLSAFDVQRRGLERHVSLGRAQPLANVAAVAKRRRKIRGQNRLLTG